ncbi:MFS transporter [Alkalihalobacterium bogoriense]|uniref:MFS transporter n=1 Tax=Alkalihalobacterium bogoriense TaxID=246272 RepID=UPI000AE224C0|nr:MFS transporter [Alkalihalobacterium bogoriense]
MRMRKIHYGWIILCLCFLALLAVQGVRLSFGAFIPSWEQEFSTTRANISLIATVSFIVYGISQPILGKLIDTFGVRKILAYSAFVVGLSTLLTFFVTSFWQIIILYGIVASIGFGGASNVAAAVAVTNWFQHKKGLALGMMTAGMSAGQLVIVPLCLYLIDWLDWKMTVLILGSFLLLVIFPLLLLFLRTSPLEMGIEPYGGIKNEQKQARKVVERTPKISTFSIVFSKSFVFLALPFLICGYTTTGLIDTHLISFSHHHGFSIGVTGAAVGLLAAFNIIGTLSSGIIADRFSNRKFLAILYALRSVTILLLLITDQWLLLLVFAVTFGLVDFATVTPTTMLASDLFSKHSLGLVLGLLSLCHQLGSALGAYIPALLYDITGGYGMALLSAIVLLLIASFMNLALPKEAREIEKTSNLVS